MAVRFEDMLARLSDQARQALVHTMSLEIAGHINRSTMLSVATDLLVGITEQSAAYGKLSYESLVSEIVQDIPAYDRALEVPSSIKDKTDRKGIARSLKTIFDGPADQQQTRLERLADELPKQNLRSGYDDAMQQDSTVEGWTRGLNDDACELCQHWARDGRIWPKDHEMPTHTGCLCQKVPAMTDRIQQTKAGAVRERRERAIANRDRSSSIVRELIETGEL